ncbi:MAG: hypothetical protein DRI83_08100, partial [Bacteroidetes bacterium]
MESTIYIVSGSALLLGAAIAWFYARIRAAAERNSIEKELEINKDRLASATISLEHTNKSLEEERRKVSELSQKLAVAGERENSLQEKFDSYRKELENLQDKFKLEFENVASKILKQNTSDFSESNRKSINEIVDPLKEK